MKFYLPTYEECVNLVKVKTDLIFYESKFNIDGYSISVFNYRLPSYSDFYDVFDAKEIRGLTFIFDQGQVWKRYLMLQKFWNLNQVPESQYTLLQHKEIKTIHNKEDGSMISFIALPNGKIIAKTRMGFDNPQTQTAMELYNNSPAIQHFVTRCLAHDLMPIFEYVSFQNKIVLNYDTANLVLLRVRSLEDGSYIDLKTLDTSGVTVAPEESYTTLAELMTAAETVENKEGWVVQFTDDSMVKQKSVWYCNLHHLLTELSNREDYIIRCVLAEQMDDVISKLDPKNDASRIAWIHSIERKIRYWLYHKKLDVDKLLLDYTGDVKSFAIKYHKHPDFSLVMSIIRGHEPYTVLKNYVQKTTKHMGDAREFLASLPEV